MLVEKVSGQDKGRRIVQRLSIRFPVRPLVDCICMIFILHLQFILIGSALLEFGLRYCAFPTEDVVSSLEFFFMAAPI